ncbi:MAG TPA: zf-HC2 domain-containing protein [Catenuloplanes sp.]
MTGAHVAPDLIVVYAGGGHLPADTAWAVEAHLDGCAGCRARLADAVTTGNPAVAAVVAGVWDVVQPQVAGLPPARRRRFPALFRWAAPTAWPWLAVTVLVPLVAVLMDLVAARVDDPRPSVLLLIAPIVPILGVAASWSRRLDEVGELVASTARTGLTLVLRRTLAVLVAVMPVLAVAGLVVGATPARWLLPCLVCTVGTLALGAVVGVARAATAVAVVWVAAVVVPGVAQSRLPAALDPTSTPAWAACAVLATAALLLWRDPLRRPASHR